MSRHPLRATVVCLAIAVSLTACDDAAEPDAAPSSAASTTDGPSSDGTTPPFGYTAWLDGLPVGAPPSIGYVIGHTYHAADGGIVHLPSDRGITAIARLGDGFLAVDDQYFEGTTGIFELDAHGNLVSGVSTVAAAPVLSRGGSTLRWITFTPLEVSPEERSPTRLHVADVATGEIRSRVLHFDRRDHVPSAPAVPARPVRRVRLPLPVPVRGDVSARTWEDRHHLLVGVVRPRVGRAAILRFDVRAGAWSVAVDWTPLERTYRVVFETTR